MHVKDCDRLPLLALDYGVDLFDDVCCFYGATPSLRMNSEPKPGTHGRLVSMSPGIQFVLPDIPLNSIGHKIAY